jgi:hypothetical protein
MSLHESLELMEANAGAFHQVSSKLNLPGEHRNGIPTGRFSPFQSHQRAPASARVEGLVLLIQSL